MTKVTIFGELFLIFQFFPDFFQTIRGSSGGHPGTPRAAPQGWPVTTITVTLGGGGREGGGGVTEVSAPALKKQPT